MKNTAAGPITATRIPPNAGPIPQPIFTATPFNVIAFLISLRGTDLSKKGEKAGVLIASPNPSRKISTKRISGEIKPTTVTMASTRAITSIQLWLIMRSLRRFTISARAPAGRASAVIERLSEAQVNATIREDATNEVISHDSPTASIRLPIFDAIAASQIALNTLYFRGDNPEEDEPLLLILILRTISLALFLSPILQCR
jgi:hypothetical protein